MMPLQLHTGPRRQRIRNHSIPFSLSPPPSTTHHYKCRPHATPQHHTTPDPTTIITTLPKMATSATAKSESLIGSENMRIAETEPLVAKATAMTAEQGKEWRRRKVGTGKGEEESRRSSPSRPARQQSFRNDFGHAAAETYLITRLSFRLLGYLGVGYRWLTRLFALGCYALLLMPGFLQVGYCYYFSSQVRRSIVYGDQPRNRLDLYLPKDSDGQRPVLIFVTGGAWIIGYKAWGSLLGQQLAERGIIVACLDYRNFPQGTISDMVEDVSQGISFVCSRIVEYGGDPNRIFLMGQSAGAHISACTLVEQAIKESEGKPVSWSVSQIKYYFGASGGYNLPGLVEHFDNRGLYRSIFLSIMEGEESLWKFSPEHMVQEKTATNAVSLLPPIILFHGTADYSIPCNASKDFVDALKSVNAEAELILFEGKTHTDLFLQDPLRGGKDELFCHLLSVIHAGDAEALAKDAIAPPNRRFVPEILLKLAREISPF